MPISSKPGYTIIVYQVMVAECIIAVLLYLVTRNVELELPLSYGTAYEILRSVLGLIFFGFFLILMVRHTSMILIAMFDQFDRSLDAAKRRKDGTEDTFTPLISIIVPAFNEGPCIESAIRSLVSLDYPRYEVIVVDDGSTDDTQMRARSLEGDHGNARVVVHWKPNGGKALALNYGIQQAASDYVVTVDGDSVLEPQTLREAIKHFTDPGVAAVAGHVTVINTVNVWSKLQALEYITALNLVRRAQGFLRAVSIVPGPIGVFRKDALAGVGFYAHDTFAEDCDVTLKLLLDGWKVVYEPLAVSRTEVPEELLALVKQRYRWTRGILQALRKYRSRMLNPKGYLTATFTLWYMVFEGLLWPFMTGAAVIFLGLASGDDSLKPAAAYFWLQLLLVDTIAITFSLAVEEMDLTLALYSPLVRTLFQVGLDITKIFASIEEFSGIQMGWGKLARKGRN